MSEPIVVKARSDQEIREEIGRLIAHYPPLQKDRNAFHVQVNGGQVVVSGHVSSPNIRTYFINLLPQVEGVTEVQADHLYDDQTIKLEVARRLPIGLKVAQVHWGQVILTGEPPAGMPDDVMAASVSGIPGVNRVIAAFGG
ncbi:MAG: BON domain-containing protein [Anaerolineae bacterium]|nr:BON domain-containing protein [Anaerolineae bacterium]